ncbi:hypothetical protein CEXT_697221 [Caerostris extrusa]|uniref:Uncharacterized protein n=1 Tax=Caerostris extrusa TaxID=172846 RepID=A0AAV4RDP9_CAEEX|nr:hypothetical protein CEXT_697221 [Caerostris extrusa]
MQVTLSCASTATSGGDRERFLRGNLQDSLPEAVLLPGERHHESGRARNAEQHVAPGSVVEAGPVHAPLSNSQLHLEGSEHRKRPPPGRKVHPPLRLRRLDEAISGGCRARSRGARTEAERPLHGDAEGDGGEARAQETRRERTAALLQERRQGAALLRHLEERQLAATLRQEHRPQSKIPPSQMASARSARDLHNVY